MCQIHSLEAFFKSIAHDIDQAFGDRGQTCGLKVVQTHPLAVLDFRLTRVNVKGQRSQPAHNVEVRSTEGGGVGVLLAECQD